MKPAPIPILFEDEAIVLINKPWGLLVHRSEETSRHEPAVVQMLRDQLKLRVYPAHRLDRATSGVLLLAKTSAAAANLGAQFASHTLQKTYLAVLRGWPDPCLKIDHPLVKFDEPSRSTQLAVTHLQRLASIELDVAVDRYPKTRYSLVRLEPETGRQHQLRRHCKSIFHPIVGDSCYGQGVHNRFFRDKLGIARLLLHHLVLRFCHPVTQELLQIRAPLEPNFEELLGCFSWQEALQSEYRR